MSSTTKRIDSLSEEKKEISVRGPSGSRSRVAYPNEFASNEARRNFWYHAIGEGNSTTEAVWKDCLVTWPIGEKNIDANVLRANRRMT